MTYQSLTRIRYGTKFGTGLFEYSWALTRKHTTFPLWSNIICVSSPSTALTTSTTTLQGFNRWNLILEGTCNSSSIWRHKINIKLSGLARFWLCYAMLPICLLLESLHPKGAARHTPLNLQMPAMCVPEDMVGDDTRHKTKRHFNNICHGLHEASQI